MKKKSTKTTKKVADKKTTVKKTTVKKTTVKKVISVKELQTKLDGLNIKLNLWNEVVKVYPGNSCFKNVRDSVKRNVNKLTLKIQSIK